MQSTQSTQIRNKNPTAIDPFLPPAPISFEMMPLSFKVPYQNGEIKVYKEPHIPQQDMKKLQKCTKFNEFIDQIRKSGSATVIDGILVRCVMIFGVYRPLTEETTQSIKQDHSKSIEKCQDLKKQEQNKEKQSSEKSQKDKNLTSLSKKDQKKKQGRIGFVVLKIQGNWSWKLRHYENFIFLQGRSVTILLFINKKILVVEQYRVPKQLTCIEPPAGMMDEQKNLNSQAIKQLSQETGIKVTPDILIELGSVRPNPRISDEEIFLYFGKIQLSEEEMEAAEKKIYGEPGTGEKIRIKFVDYDQKMIRETGNCAFIMLAAFYEDYLRKEKLKQTQNKPE